MGNIDDSGGTREEKAVLLAEHAEIAAKRISKPAQAPLFVSGSNDVSRATQSQLFEEEEGDQ